MNKSYSSKSHGLEDTNPDILNSPLVTNTFEMEKAKQEEHSLYLRIDNQEIDVNIDDYPEPEVMKSPSRGETTRLPVPVLYGIDLLAQRKRGHSKYTQRSNGDNPDSRRNRAMSSVYATLTPAEVLTLKL